MQISAKPEKLASNLIMNITKMGKTLKYEKLMVVRIRKMQISYETRMACVPLMIHRLAFFLRRIIIPVGKNACLWPPIIMQ